MGKYHQTFKTFRQLGKVIEPSILEEILVDHISYQTIDLPLFVELLEFALEEQMEDAR